MLTLDRAREVLAYDKKTGYLTWKVEKGRRAKTGAVAGSINGEKESIRIIVDGEKHLAHRLAWLIVTGAWPASKLDHENGVKSDNAWKNLRPATNAQNLQNQKKATAGNKSTGFLGVSRVTKSKTFRARITLDGKTIEIGHFATPHEAHQAYIEAKRQLHTHGTI